MTLITIACGRFTYQKQHQFGEFHGCISGISQFGAASPLAAGAAASWARALLLGGVRDAPDANVLSLCPNPPGGVFATLRQ